MKSLIWEKFKEEKLHKILIEKEKIVDIGGGLKAWKNKGNRYEEHNFPNVDKVILMDLVNDYNPDIVGDIHKMPFENDSLDAIICHAVLEHVLNPFTATKEMYRTLKKGGYCYVYVPFLYCYHAEKDYYKDYWRFSKDALELLFKDFSTVEIVPIRGAISTLISLTPLASKFPKLKKPLDKFGYILDKIFKKDKTNQVSGYSIFLIK